MAPAATKNLLYSPFGGAALSLVRRHPPLGAKAPSARYEPCWNSSGPKALLPRCVAISMP